MCNIFTGKRENEAEITYWIDKKFWGQGIATTALKELLKIEQDQANLWTR